MEQLAALDAAPTPKAPAELIAGLRGGELIWKSASAHARRRSNPLRATLAMRA
jgi:hypothetical protein